MSKILLVEDDQDLSTIVRNHLLSERYTVELVMDGNSASEMLAVAQFDLIILDWDLPYKTGVEVCAEFRAKGGKTPIIMLTGKKQIEEKEKGFDSGADDYLTKPFSLRELSVRVKALLRRPEQYVQTKLKAGALEMDLTKHSVVKDGASIHLQPQDFALLEFLMKHQDQVFTSEALLARVWDTDSEATTESVRSAIKRLRQKLDEADATSSIIENIPRVGYRLNSN